MPVGDKHKKLEAILASYPRLLVAFSGGVDSTFLLAAARDVLPDRVEAATSISPVHSRRESENAEKLAKALGVVHHRMSTAEMSLPAFLTNPENRCYICKQHLFARMRELAAGRGIETIAHGANADDLDDYRPGFRAAMEAGIVAPLVEAGLKKAEIRELAREKGLPNWNRPSDACLATRVPHGTLLSPALLERIEQAESVLADRGVDGCRVRVHGNIARIEVAPEQFDRVMSAEVRLPLIAALRGLGFDHVSLDLEGYRMGSMNRSLKNKRKRSDRSFT